jgi:hypothetical protein
VAANELFDRNGRKGYIFHYPQREGRAYEAFQGLFSHTDGKIRDGYGEDGCGRGVVGTERLILIILSMIRDHDMMKKSHTGNRG